MIIVSKTCKAFECFDPPGSTKDSVLWATGRGYLGILKWLIENRYEWDKRVCACAARNNHLEVLKWAREDRPGGPFPWDEWACAGAAREVTLRR